MKLLALPLRNTRAYIIYKITSTKEKVEKIDSCLLARSASTAYPGIFALDHQYAFVQIAIGKSTQTFGV